MAAHATSPQLQRGLPSASPRPRGAGLEESAGVGEEAAWYPHIPLRRGRAEPHYLLVHGAQTACLHAGDAGNTRASPGMALGNGPYPVAGGGLTCWHKGMHITEHSPPNIPFPKSPPSYGTDLQAFLLLPDPALPGTAGSQIRQTSDGRQLMEQGTAKTQKRQTWPQGEQGEPATQNGEALQSTDPQPAQNLATKLPLFPAFSISSY